MVLCWGASEDKQIFTGEFLESRAKCKVQMFLMTGESRVHLETVTA